MARARPAEAVVLLVLLALALAMEMLELCIHNNSLLMSCSLRRCLAVVPVPPGSAGRAAVPNG